MNFIVRESSNLSLGTKVPVVCGSSSVVECLLAKEKVASSSLVFRSISLKSSLLCCLTAQNIFDFYACTEYAICAFIRIRRRSQVARQGSAKPPSAVRIRSSPPSLPSRRFVSVLTHYPNISFISKSITFFRASASSNTHGVKAHMQIIRYPTIF